MPAIEALKSRLIERIRSSSNEEFLSAIENLALTWEDSEEELVLSPAQIDILLMSELDIEEDRLFSQAQVDAMDEDATC